MIVPISLYSSKISQKKKQIYLTVTSKLPIRKTDIKKNNES
jgi:hypothetical protein